MNYYVQAEVRVEGRYQRMYLWRGGLWRRARSEAQVFPDSAEAQAALDQIDTDSRPIRNLKIVSGAETTAGFRRQRRRRPNRWKAYQER